jgi:hypothetical protein
MLDIPISSLHIFVVLDIIGPGGSIKGCFDETFEGITVRQIISFLLSAV